MKVLFVYGGNGKKMPFIEEQKKSIEKLGVYIEEFQIIGKGIFGYLGNLNRLKAKVRDGRFDLIHAHYGLSGMLSVMQRIVPVVTTFHGSDVNINRNLPFSIIVSRLSKHNILVNCDMVDRLKLKNNLSVIPCGVDLSIFHPMEKTKARELLGLDIDKNYVLFTSDFDNKVKNYPFAKKVIEFTEPTAKLLEIKGRSRDEVNILLNASDAILMTSFSEGSPQIIKEALATNTPIVSTDVGDVSDLILNVENCYLIDYSVKDASEIVSQTIINQKRTNGRSKALGFDINTVAFNIYNIYEDATS